MGYIDEAYGYLYGIKTEKNYLEAWNKFCMAYNYDSSMEAAYMMGYMLEKGLHIEANINKAVEFYSGAANNNYGYAQLKLAQMCESGIFGEAGKSNADGWYKCAAENGVEEAVDYLLDKYEKLKETMGSKRASFIEQLEISGWVADCVKLQAPQGYLVGLDKENWTMELSLKDSSLDKIYFKDMISGSIFTQECDVNILVDTMPPALDMNSFNFYEGERKLESVNRHIICNNTVTGSFVIEEQESGLNVDSVQMFFVGKKGEESIKTPVSIIGVEGQASDGYKVKFEMGSQCKGQGRLVIECCDNVGHKAVVESNGSNIPFLYLNPDPMTVTLYDYAKLKDNQPENSAVIDEKEPIDGKADIELKLDGLHKCNPLKEFAIKLDGNDIFVDKDNISLGYIKTRIRIDKPGKYTIEVKAIDSIGNDITKQFNIQINSDTHSQFSFVEGLNEELYNHLFEAEKALKTDIEAAGGRIRKGLESFIKMIIDEKFSSEIFVSANMSTSQGDTRFEGVSLTDDRIPLASKIKAINYLDSTGRLLPLYNVKQEYVNINNINVNNFDIYTFIRGFGNACSHTGDINKRYIPKVVYKNGVKILTAFHKLLKAYVDDNDIPPFDEKLLPIGDYFIESCSKQVGGKTSGCRAEYIGFKRLRNGKKRYAFIREYKKAGIDENFILRNSDVYDAVIEDNDDDRPQGIAGIRSIGNVNDSKSEFYYVVNEMGTARPRKLSDIVGKLELKERLQVCASVGTCLEAIHASNIYHRFLDYTNIYVCDGKSKKVSYIVKFDFAKLYNMDTVVEHLMTAEKEKSAASVQKYIAPEAMTALDNDVVFDWSRVDIFSYGILCRDIILGKFGGSRVSSKELKTIGISDELISLLDDMVGIPENRPVISDVVDCLSREIVG